MSETYSPAGTLGNALTRFTSAEAATGTFGTMDRSNITEFADRTRYLAPTTGLYAPASGTTAMQAVTATTIVASSTIAGTRFTAGTTKVTTGVVSTGVSTLATDIYVPVGGFGSVMFVHGESQGGAANAFTDLVTFMPGVSGAVAAQVSTTVRGSPAARTYTTTGSTIKLAMASGTYDIAVAPIELS